MDYPYINALLEKAEKTKKLHDKLSRWSESPSQSEIDKCERAERMIKEALDVDPKLSKMTIKVFAKGSYANRTNIPGDSDVDVAVLNEDQFFIDCPPGKTDSDYNFSSTGYNFTDYFNDVAVAVIRKFGSDSVTVGTKCITVKSNTSRVEADVVPHFKNRRFQSNGVTVDGVAIWTSSGKIQNYPVQDYDNGIIKNADTAKRYKGFVRIIKNLRSEMMSKKISSAEKAKSYLISCLVWNVPNELFKGDDYGFVLRNILNHLILKTSDASAVSDWGEVNELKYLFTSNQGWTLAEAHKFLIDAKNYLDVI
ncbi:MAG: nucleotidyltransferase [Bdellovibrionota bacterium]